MEFKRCRLYDYLLHLKKQNVLPHGVMFQMKDRKFLQVQPSILFETKLILGN